MFHCLLLTINSGQRKNSFKGTKIFKSCKATFGMGQEETGEMCIQDVHGVQEMPNDLGNIQKLNIRQWLGFMLPRSRFAKIGP